MEKGQVISAILVSVFSTAALHAGAQGGFQERMLFSPGPEILQAEARGRIMIYDGLRSDTVEKALDSQFSRIGNMMFVRTVYAQANGEYEVEDECD